MSKITENLYTGETKTYTDFLKHEIMLKILRCTKIILQEDLKYLRDTTSGRINWYLEKYKGNDVRLCSDKDRHSEVETQGQWVREWVSDKGAE